MSVGWLLALAFAQAPKTAEFRSNDLGLAFTHPKAWAFATRRGVSKAAIAVGTAGERAMLEIQPTVYSQAAEEWQQLQALAIQQMKREMVRQWKEEILGVPLLLTRCSYRRGEQDRTQLVGLLYSRTPKKLLFRLDSPREGYEGVEFELRAALQTLHTLDGSLPSVEDPAHPMTPAEAAKKSEPPPKVTQIEDDHKGGGPVKGGASLPMAAGGAKLALRFGTGWSGSPTGEDIVLKHPEVKGEIKVAARSLLDSDPARKALLKASSVSLNLFEKVAQREETLPTTNKAGVAVARVWRFGAATAGEMASCDATGQAGNFYWQAAFLKQGAVSAAERKLVDALLDGLSLEPAS
ncbi:MAG: hypothetical protein HYR64_08110 [Fimbriimonas ginsengisoli]|uniref:Tle cognate immunity protein 4 C-terminal domain-containing protein n=1 Tax=Fimbriimonas ginsengisoli TaxID=1005039 RepID=A0A931LTI6_FIMGI|nr:hypothetical protein [Fimbriimonas ginsengisoli]